MVEKTVCPEQCGHNQLTLRQARQIRRISGGEMANILQVTPAKYAFWERFPSQMPWEMAQQFAAAAALPLDCLFFQKRSTLSRSKRKKGTAILFRNGAFEPCGGARRCLLCGEEMAEREDCSPRHEKRRGAWFWEHWGKKARKGEQKVEFLYNGGEPFGNGGVCADCLSRFWADRQISKAAKTWDQTDFARYLVERFGSDRKEGRL